MDIWNPSEEDRKTPEYLRFIIYFLQSGAQQRSDWKWYPRRGDFFSPIPKKRPQTDFAFKKGNHYELKGCNLHDRSEWVRYVRTDGDYAKVQSN